MNRVRRLKLMLWTLLGLGTAAAIMRLVLGLGATTNLSDATPWGLWVGFDLSAVAFAAGGFVLTATVYIFKLERFHKLVRLGLLASLLTYLAFTTVLLFELGLPWNIWHMTIYWNPHSPLFEVGWCVMLYTMVLVLEFLPIPAEEFPRLATFRRVLMKVRLPLVLIGIGLSTLHQSSLGSLFLIMPYRLHPLWYSRLLPVLFLISAIALGLAMVIFENHATAYLYRRRPETDLLKSFGTACGSALALYLVVRFSDLIVRHQARSLIAGNWRTALFWLEIVMLGVVPIILFVVPRLRRTRGGQWWASTLVVCGVVLNRIDIGGLTSVRPGGAFYVPSWIEIAIAAGIVSAAVLAFLAIIEHFKVWEDRPADPAADPLKLPELNAVGNTWLGIPSIAGRTTYSLGFVIAAALGFALINVQQRVERGTEPTPVHQARGGDILFIDGNLDGFGVAFKHAEHEKREGDKQSCVKCHHMNIPRDEASACSRCHRDEYLTTDSFRHDWHASPAGGNVPCYQCHAPGQVRRAATAARCDTCHRNLVPKSASIAVKQYRAVGYAQAMHELCLGCHVKKAKEKSKPEMAQCEWCHKDRCNIADRRKVVRQSGVPGRNVVLPSAEPSQSSQTK
jgi:Ni/Fe-hydrogenase subunit HybB-like protein